MAPECSAQSNKLKDGNHTHINDRQRTTTPAACARTSRACAGGGARMRGYMAVVPSEGPFRPVMMRRGSRTREREMGERMLGRGTLGCLGRSTSGYWGHDGGW